MTNKNDNERSECRNDRFSDIVAIQTIRKCSFELDPGCEKLELLGRRTRKHFDDDDDDNDDIKTLFADVGVFAVAPRLETRCSKSVQPKREILLRS